MLRFIASAPRLRLLLVAGTATRTRYLNEFLARYAPAGGGRLDGRCERKPGEKGFTQYHELMLGERRIPLFFCSSGPSNQRARAIVVDRVSAERARLAAYLAGDGA